MKKSVSEKMKTSKLGSYKKGIYISVSAAALAVTVTVVGFNTLATQAQADEAANAINQYKEEEVIRGDIVVGVTELGSASLFDTSLSFEFETEVLEVYVRPGEYVEEGQVVATIDTQNFSDSYDDVLLELQDAQLSLEKAVLSANSQKFDAEQDYNTSVLDGESAQYEHTQSSQNLQDGYQDILDDLADLEDEMLLLLADDYDEYEENYNEAVQDLEDEIQELEFDIDDKYEEINAASSSDDSTGESGSGGTTVDVEKLIDELDALEEQLDNKEDELSDLVESYADGYDSLDEKVAELEEQIADKLEELEDYEASMEGAQAKIDADYDSIMYDYNNAQAQYNNSVATANNDISSAQIKVNDLVDELAEIEAMRTDGEVLAPCSGYVMSLADVGDELNTNSSLISIADSTAVYLSVSIPQEDIADINIDMPVNISFDAYEDVVISAIVDSISITPSGGMTSSVNYTVTVLCDLSEYQDCVIYEGMTAEVTFIERQKEEVLIVSNKCIIIEDGKSYVKMYDDMGTVQMVEVVTGFSDGFDVEIIEGLAEGDVVLIESVVLTSASE